MILSPSCKGKSSSGFPSSIMRLASTLNSCFFAPSETSGEKPYEEFHTDSDEVDTSRFDAVGVLCPKFEKRDAKALAEFIDFARRARETGVSKADYVAAFRSLLGDFEHIETGRNLDQRM